MIYNLSRSCLLHPILRKNLFYPFSLHQARQVTLKPVIMDFNANLPFEEKNKVLKRPLSPHLSIYKPQMTTILSITHRMTGLAIVTYVIALASIYPLHYDVMEIVGTIKSLELSASTSIAIKSILGLPIAYHFANGIRHLVWDFGKLLTNQGVIKSGYVMLILTIVFTAVLANL